MLQRVQNSEDEMEDAVNYLVDKISYLRQIIKKYEDEHDKRRTSNYQILENGSIGIIDEHSQHLLYSTYDASFHLVDTESIPDLPHTGNCKWTYNEETHVVLANFQKQTIKEKDENFLLQMMERDDVTVVIEGLVSSLNTKLWDHK